MKLDLIDRKILELLQADSKRTNKELSHKLQLSVTAVYERIRKMEREGVISKYVALLPDQTGTAHKIQCNTVRNAGGKVTRGAGMLPREWGI